jgi:hypothetical protein
MCMIWIPSTSASFHTTQAEQMLGVPRSDWFRGSFESGQMVVDKARHWRGLLTAAWLNSYASCW